MMIDKYSFHHWSGWPGAYCMKCMGPDPVEEALGEGQLFDDLDDDDPDFMKARTSEIQDKINKLSICAIKGELKWNAKDAGWDIEKPDGAVEPFLRFKDHA